MSGSVRVWVEYIVAGSWGCSPCDCHAPMVLVSLRDRGHARVPPAVRGVPPCVSAADGDEHFVSL